MPDLTGKTRRLEIYIEQLLIHLRSMPRRSPESTLVRSTIKQMMERRREYEQGATLRDPLLAFACLTRSPDLAVNIRKRNLARRASLSQ